MLARRLNTLSLVAFLAAGLLAPGAGAASTAANPALARADAPFADQLGPGIQYQEAMAHAGDRIAFTPGRAVTVPFRPRAGDAWTVDGQAPRQLPAGRLSGRQLLTSPGGAPGAQSRGIHGGASGRQPQGAPARAPGGQPQGAPARAPGGQTQGAGAGDFLLAGFQQPAVAQGLALQAQVAPGGLKREVFGFLPYWELTDPALSLNYSLLSTIAYFAVVSDGNGNLITQDSDGQPDVGWAGWTSSQMTAIIDQAHAAGTRVVLTVERFSWTTSQRATTTALLSSATARQNLATQIAAAVRNRGADGVNLDFEPIPPGQGPDYVAFVQQLRAALDAAQPGYQLTFDATGDPSSYDITALTAPGAADAVFVMGYDYRSCSSGTAGSTDPLVNPTRFDLTDTVATYLSQTTPDKVILGLPFYGYAWSTTSNALDAPTQPQGATYGYCVAVYYDTAAQLAQQYGRQYDPLEQTAWFAYQRQNCATCPTTWREVYYDDAQSLTAKYQLINQSNLRGAGIWALGYDGQLPDLQGALQAAFVDTTPPNPPPILGAVTPATVPAGGGDLSVTLQGANFASGVSSAYWNGTPLATSYVSPDQLTATVPAALTATQGQAMLTVVNGPPGGGTSSPVPFTVSVPAAQLSVTPSTGVITWGQKVTLAVQIAQFGANRSVTLQRMQANETQWSDIATLTTDATGHATFDYTPPVNTQFQAVYAGTPDLAAGTSPPVRVVVRQLVLLRPTNLGTLKSVPAGTQVTFTATVRPIGPTLAPAKATFQFWRLLGGHWTLAASRTASADTGGRASTTWSFGTRGQWYVRVVADPTATNANSYWSPPERYSVY